LGFQKVILIALERYAPDEFAGFTIHQLKFDTESEALSNWNQGAV
jgi:hypothetical protein